MIGKKVIKNNNFISLQSGLFIIGEILCFLFIIWSELEFLNGLLTFIICTFIGYIFFSNFFFYFEYDNDKIIVKNSWKPFFIREIEIKKVKEVNINFVFFAGNSISFNLENKKYSYPVGAITLVELNQMKKDLEALNSSK